MAATTTQAPNFDYYSSKLFEITSTYKPNDADLEQPLPGFPSRYKGERVWTGSEIALKEDEWATVLSEQDQKHIVEALRHFQSLNLHPECLTAETFPLPQELHDRLRKISHDVYEGRGFGVLRGLRPEIFTEEENVLVYGGISSHVAPERGFQDVNRELVTCHVISEELRPGAEDQDLRPAFTNGKLAFHTDVGDILSLFAMDVSNNGGETMIVSSCHLYNEFAETRPDLLRELGENWVSFPSQDYYTDGTPLITNAPGDKLVFQYSRLPITGFRNKGANPTIPAPTQKRLEAMTLVEDLAWKNAFPLPTKRGDIAYINNFCIMHARNSFDLDAEGKPLPSRRHLVKMMFKDPELTWDLPESLSWYSQRVYGPNRDDGGRKEKWQLSIASDESLPDGRIWAGSGSFNNG
ncbi:hypothetical protein NM208_g4434 [Fusarium decemcellulare]|uniref:Uncharacterized protein n=1 Tax=Fusarium decemcellulare TaxID=57161 RepID=A0ACC1SKP7_9HYPO|nr:hypothetical protein NM208_g4434 [Fusarium decemcellulare]